MARKGRQDFVLVSEYRPGLDGLRDAAATRSAPVVRVGQRRLLRGTLARLHRPTRQCAARMAPTARRSHLHRGRRPALCMDRVAGAEKLPLWRDGPTNSPNIRSISKSTPQVPRWSRSDRDRSRGLRLAGRGYALMLVAFAWGFDLAARKSSARAARWRTGGFVYHTDHDALGLPAGPMVVADVVRPRAPGHAVSRLADGMQRLSRQEHCTTCRTVARSVARSIPGRIRKRDGFIGASLVRLPDWRL